MNRINDKSSLIKEIQIYLATVGNSEIYAAPSGVYDENTRLSVLDFQKRNSIKETGTVNIETLDLLYGEYIRIKNNEELAKKYSLPISEKENGDAIREINNNLITLLNFYGHTHRIKANSSYYSKDTADGVKILRKIYLLGDTDFIDEKLLDMIKKDLHSIDNDKRIRR